MNMQIFLLFFVASLGLIYLNDSVPQSLALCFFFSLLKLLIYADAGDVGWDVAQITLIASRCCNNWPFLFMFFNWLLIQEWTFPSLLGTFFEFNWKFRCN